MAGGTLATPGCSTCRSTATAAALVDAHGDGADINIDIYVRSPDGEWSEIASGNGDLGIPGWQASSDDDQRLVLTRTTHD